MADGISLSQDELNRVLNNVRKDNDEHEKAPVSAGVSLSQSELEKLFGGASSSAPAATPATPAEQSQADKDAARAAKIEERKRHAAELLAQANASSPKRISVVYGAATRRGHELESIKPGDWIELDRIEPEYADILVDGKLFARGIPSYKDQHASIQITQIV